MKLFVVLGSVNAFFAVALGAFGAHGLKSRVAQELLAVWETAVQYHMAHALGLLLLGILAGLYPQAQLLRTSGWFLVAGLMFFSGSLYLLVLTGVRSFGAVTPIGGVAFLLGWLLLAVAVWKQI